MRGILVLIIALTLSNGCIATPTPTPPTPVPTPIPSPSIAPEPPAAELPTPIGNRQAPAGVPGCKEARSMDQALQFTWVGIEDVIQNTPAANWTYYHCGQSRAALTAFYQHWMPRQPYGWIEYHWEERPEATMAVYYYTTSTAGVPNRWLHLWILPDSSTAEGSNLVAAWWGVPKSC